VTVHAGESKLDKVVHAVGSHAHTVVQVGGVTALSSGLVGWLTENHIIITSLGIFVGALVGVTGIYVQLTRSRLENKEARLRIASLKREAARAERQASFQSKANKD